MIDPAPRTQWLHAKDGTALFVREFGANGAKDQPTLVWIHGLGEHGGRYEHAIARILSRGWRVVFADLRGHGRSAGIRAHVRVFDEYVADAAQIWAALECRPERTAILGNSMGGLVTIRMLEQDLVRPVASILIAPLLGIKVDIPMTTWLAGRLVSLIAPQTRFASRIDPKNMTRDPEFLAARQRDPFMQRSVTAGWFFAMRSALRLAYRDAKTLTTPLLTFCGDKDQTIEPECLVAFLRSTSIPEEDRPLILLRDHLHELLHEPDWESTVDTMLDWLERRISSN
jgi:lysophospholipase